MDARVGKHRPLRAGVTRIAAGTLCALLAWGLWEGFGNWILAGLFGGAGAHAP
jgi:hypothetical protein